MMRVSWRPKIAPLALFVGALLIRLARASLIPVVGDELSIFREAQDFNNLNGIAYFFLMHFWLAGGESALWLRLPSILLGALAVPICWLWLREVRNPFVAWLTALLLMFSPLAVEFSQEVRFYALFLFSAVLFFWLYWRYISTPAAERRSWQIVALLLAGALTLASQFMGALVVGFTLIHWLFFYFPPVAGRRRVFLFVAAGLLLLLFMVMAVAPDILERGYQIVRGLSASPVPQSYTGGRGLSAITVLKLGLLYYTLTFGQFVYPLKLIVVLPGLLMATAASIAGLIGLFRLENKRILAFVALVGGGSVATLYLGFDALWPAGYRDSAAPRYVLFVLPLFLWVLAEGVDLLRRDLQSKPHLTRPLKIQWPIGFAAALIVLQGVGLMHLYFPEWYSGQKASEFAPAFDHLTAYSVRQPLRIYADGRASGLVEYYLGGHIQIDSAWNLGDPALNLPEQETIAFASLDDRAEIRCPLNAGLLRLNRNQEAFAWVSYPLFVYVYSPSAASPNLDEILIPRAVYSLEFADLRLPAAAEWGGRLYPITGMYFLPDCQERPTLRLDELSPGQARGLLLFSNTLKADNIADGTPIAEVALTGGDGTTSRHILRMGYETQRWNGACRENCRAALTWHKRALLVGASAYSEAYHDFQAKIWGTEIAFSQPIDIQRIEITVLEPGISLNIWGLYVMR